MLNPHVRDFVAHAALDFAPRVAIKTLARIKIWVQDALDWVFPEVTDDDEDDNVHIGDVVYVKTLPIEDEQEPPLRYFDYCIAPDSRHEYAVILPTDKDLHAWESDARSKEPHTPVPLIDLMLLLPKRGAGTRLLSATHVFQKMAGRQGDWKATRSTRMQWLVRTLLHVQQRQPLAKDELKTAVALFSLNGVTAMLRFDEFENPETLTLGDLMDRCCILDAEQFRSKYLSTQQTASSVPADSRACVGS